MSGEQPAGLASSCHLSFVLPSSRHILLTEHSQAHQGSHPPPVMERSASAALSAETPITRSSTVPAVTKRSTRTCG